MSFDLGLISSAYAQAPAAPQEPNLLLQLAPMLVIFAIFYFLLIRPQMKRAKELKQLVESLAKGDEVVTNGGLAGRVVNVGDDFLGLEVADGVVVKVQKQAVTLVLPKGSLKKT
ncbi:preprotein translocase subunit YajC [Thermithiobacillus tepidarius DSM 3134]|uniref:preprotein translocase subunit YajC n=1 Tax=Thermithiobacillus tepidarius TaxID=929 RepID=UPI00040C27C5|nr:preprotein translocase subunit YajC [Thermithiobacillus tepidarius]